MRVPKLKLKINLDDLFGSNNTYSTATKQKIGQQIIDRIAERTQSGIDKYGKSLGRYSASYANSLDGQVFGKRKGGQVNLTATGDMLDSLTIIDQTAKTITIGWDDSLQNDKAYGHITGFEGHPTLAGKVKQRDFFGLPDKELKKIAKDNETSVTSTSRIEKAETVDEFNKAIEAAIADIEGEIGG